MKHLVCLGAVVCAACSTVSEVMLAGQDTHTVGSNARGGLSSDFEVKALAIRKAKPPKMSMALFAWTLLLGAIAGCATTSTGPVPAGAGTFVVSRQAGALPSGREPLLAEALAEANAKCSNLGKTMTLISSSENSGPYVFGNYPKATVVFSCG